MNALLPYNIGKSKGKNPGGRARMNMMHTNTAHTNLTRTNMTHTNITHTTT